MLFLAMMFLAPTPFMVVLQKSDHEATRSSIAIGRSVRNSVASYESDAADAVERASSLASSCAGDEDSVESKHGVEGVELTKSPSKSSDSRDRNASLGWRNTVGMMPGASLLRSRVLTKQNVETRMASRNLAMQLAASQTGGNSMGVLEVENADEVFTPDDPYMDTRLVLLKKYGGGHVPTSVKIGYRLDALKKSLSTLTSESSRSGMSRDVATIWFVWFLVLCVEKYTPDSSIHSNIFNCIFEICSAFGNVGLSIGSSKVNGASFSADLHIFNQFVLICVMVLGRTREFPSEIDGSLQLVSGDIISAAFLKPGAVVRRQETAIKAVEPNPEESGSPHQDQSTSPSPPSALDGAIGATDV